MSKLRKSITNVAWIAAALFMTAMQEASAQGLSVAGYHIHRRYIAIAAIVLIVIVVFAVRAKNAGKQAAEPTASGTDTSSGS